MVASIALPRLLGTCSRLLDHNEARSITICDRVLLGVASSTIAAFMQRVQRDGLTMPIEPIGCVDGCPASARLLSPSSSRLANCNENADKGQASGQRRQ